MAMIRVAAANSKDVRTLLAVVLGLSGYAADESELSAAAAPAPRPPGVTYVTTPGAGFSSKVVQLDTRPAATGDACGGMSEHGVFGIEERVVDAIVRFMVGQ